jgi:hypothetical protein
MSGHLSFRLFLLFFKVGPLKGTVMHIVGVCDGKSWTNLTACLPVHLLVAAIMANCGVSWNQFFGELLCQF